MIGSIVLPLQSPGTQQPDLPSPQPASAHRQTVDPLSEVLALIKPHVYVSGGFAVRGDVAIYFPKHHGVKCYAMLAGQCWLVLDDAVEPVSLVSGDCFLLPRGLPFRLTTDLSLPPVHYSVARDRHNMTFETPAAIEGATYIAGGHFALSGGAAEMLLQSLPPVVHIRQESDRAAIRSSIERMREELSEAKPGASLIAQHLAYMMLIQALRIHLTDGGNASPGLLLALSDKQMSVAITSMHNEPGLPWTLQSLAERVGMSRSVFSLRFREVVGVTPMEYLTRWRMFLAADRLTHSSDGLSSIAQSLGYESDSAFGKAFRRIMGHSPRQYSRFGPGEPLASHTPDQRAIAQDGVTPAVPTP
jgi:AraC-like DNA-binding protein